MQIAKRQNKKVKILIGLLLLLLIGGGVAAFYLFHTSSKPASQQGDINYGAPTTEQQAAGYQSKKDFLDKTDPSKTSSPSPSGTAAAVTITSTSQSGDTLSVRATIDTLSTDGQCTVQIAKAGTDTVSYSDTASLQSYGSYSVCKGFDVPLSKLGSGDWNVTITYTVGSASSTDKKVVTVG